MPNANVPNPGMLDSNAALQRISLLEAVDLLKRLDEWSLEGDRQVTLDMRSNGKTELWLYDFTYMAGTFIEDFDGPLPDKHFFKRKKQQRLEADLKRINETN